VSYRTQDVSILIPSTTARPYVRKAVQSILDQTLTELAVRDRQRRIRPTGPANFYPQSTTIASLILTKRMPASRRRSSHGLEHCTGALHLRGWMPRHLRIPPAWPDASGLSRRAYQKSAVGRVASCALGKSRRRREPSTAVDAQSDQSALDGRPACDGARVDRFASDALRAANGYWCFPALVRSTT